MNKKCSELHITEVKIIASERQLSSLCEMLNFEVH